MSALNGDMIVERGDNMDWYQGTTLLNLLDNIAIEHDVNTTDFRYPVQWVCRPQTEEYHDFRGFMGRIEAGEIAVGDEITVLPSGRSSKVKEIVTYDGKLQRAYAPQSVTLTLEDEIDISRGDMFVKARRIRRESQKNSRRCCAGCRNRRWTRTANTSSSTPRAPRSAYSPASNTAWT